MNRDSSANELSSIVEEEIAGGRKKFLSTKNEKHFCVSDSRISEGIKSLNRVLMFNFIADSACSSRFSDVIPPKKQANL